MSLMSEDTVSAERRIATDCSMLFIVPIPSPSTDHVKRRADPYLCTSLRESGREAEREGERLKEDEKEEEVRVHHTIVLDGSQCPSLLCGA